MNEIIHHERKNAKYYSVEDPEYTFNYSVLANNVIKDAYNIIYENLVLKPGGANILRQVKIAMDKATASAPEVAASAPQNQGSPTLKRVLSSGSGTLGPQLTPSEVAVAPISSNLAKLLSYGNVGNSAATAATD